MKKIPNFKKHDSNPWRVHKSFNASLLIFRYCRVKVARNSSGLAINVTYIKRLGKPFNTRFILSYKYGQIYREVIRVPEFELCGVLRNYNLLPPFIKALLDIFGETMGKFLKGCPYEGVYDVVMEMDMSKFPSILPSGMYKSDVSIKTIGSKIFQMFMEIEIVSNIKTSFWELR